MTIRCDKVRFVFYCDFHTYAYHIRECLEEISRATLRVHLDISTESLQYYHINDLESLTAEACTKFMSEVFPPNVTIRTYL